MSKFVQIQSTMNITVTPGLNNKDVTNKDAHVADRLKIAALWPKGTVDIKQGVGYYPAYITKWNTVKALADKKVLTIGQYFEELPSGATEEEGRKAKKLDQAMKEIKAAEGKEIKEIKLEDIAGE